MTIHRVMSKPRKGEMTAERRSRAARLKRIEKAAKLAAKRRDEFKCRRCGKDCTFAGAEAAHIDTKGMGGDHGLSSSLRSDYVTLCTDCHQGPRSLHSGHVVLSCGPLRGDGDVTFVERSLAWKGVLSL